MDHVRLATMDRLHGWILGLPWVVERPGVTAAPALRWFAVDCEPLGRRRLWLLSGSLDGIAGDDLAIHVVLRTPASRRIVNAGVGTVAAALGVEHHLVSIRLDATEPGDVARLERVLLHGYEASFT